MKCIEEAIGNKDINQIRKTSNKCKLNEKHF